MASRAHPPSVIRFGQFELDAASGELRKAGIPLKIHPQPFQVLQLLTGRPRQIVTRDEIRATLWGNNIFVDFERGINSCVNQIRATLGDDPEKPRYVETLPRRGYRFIAAVTNGASQQTVDMSPLSVSAKCDNGSHQTVHTSEVPFLPPPSTRNPAEHWKAMAAIAALVGFGVLVTAAIFYFRSPAKLTVQHSIVLADFTNTTGDEVFDDTLKQAVAVDLGQSPFLNIISEETVRETLRQMTRSGNERLTQDLAREVCQRTGSKAYLAGSIAALGTQYVIGLEALNCTNGEVLAREQVTAAGKEHVLLVLGEGVAKLRNEVGESLSSVQKFDVPLEQATTNSLEALKAFSIGRKTENEKGYAEAIPFNKRAIELDPNFALAYDALGNDYYSMDEHGLGVTYLKKAFELRDRVTEREKFHITGLYYSIATGDLEKSNQIYELWIQVYPRDAAPYINLGNNDMVLGKYEKAATETVEALGLGDWTLPHENLGEIYLALNRFDEARTATEVALTRQLNGVGLHVNLYALAFFEGDAAAMKQQAEWGSRIGWGRPDAFARVRYRSLVWETRESPRTVSAGC